MREIRPSGSEGGAGQMPRSYLYPNTDPRSTRPYFLCTTFFKGIQLAQPIGPPEVEHCVRLIHTL